MMTWDGQPSYQSQRLSLLHSCWTKRMLEGFWRSLPLMTGGNHRHVLKTTQCLTWNQRTSVDVAQNRLLCGDYFLHLALCTPSVACQNPVYVALLVVAWRVFVCSGVPNSGFRLFGRIRIALAAEHCDAAPAVLIFTTSLCPSLISAMPGMPACCLAITLSPSIV